MLNPWVLLAVLLLTITAAFGGYKNGRKVESAAWLAKENVELAAANDKILDLTKKARDQEQAHALAVNLISTTLQRQTDVAKAAVERVKRDVRNGTFQLRDPAARREACGGTASGATAASGQRNGGSSAGLPSATSGILSGAASEFLVGEAGRANEVVLQLIACQGVIIDDRKIK